MKPKNNRPICPDCGRPKLLFETEKKALNFIKFNGEEILRDEQTTDDLRAYYCPSCCGWHITSKPYKKTYEHRTDRLIERYRKEKANKTFVWALKLSNDEIIKDIKENAQKENVSSKKQFKKWLDTYFANHNYTKQQECEIRHQINILIKNKK